MAPQERRQIHTHKRPVMSSPLETAFSHATRAIDTLTQQIERRTLLDRGRHYFDFEDTSPGSLIATHTANVRALAAARSSAVEAKLETVRATPVARFQELLRVQEEERLHNVQLVGIDVSGTIIYYHSTPETRARAAQHLSGYLDSQRIPRPPEVITDAIVKGFDEYHVDRQKDWLERPEREVYKTYIFNKLDIGQDVPDEVVDTFTRIWREESVDLELVPKQLPALVNELKSRGLKVVTVADMLGPMTDEALKKLGVSQLFDLSFTSDKFEHRKRTYKANYESILEFSMRRDPRDGQSLYRIINSVASVSAGNSIMIGNDEIDDIKSSVVDAGWKGAAFVRRGAKEATSKYPYGKVLGYESLDDFYDALMADQVPLLPKVTPTPYFGRIAAQREGIDTDFAQLTYGLRSVAKQIPDRNLREWVYRNYLAYHIGEDTRIGNNVEIRFPERIWIGNNCQINDEFKALNEAPVIIGNNVMIAANVFIATHMHDWLQGMLQSDVPSWLKGDTNVAPVSIEDNVWIAPYVGIGPGTYVGHHSIIHPFTFVPTGVYPPYSEIGTKNGKTIVRSLQKQLALMEKALPNK